MVHSKWVLSSALLLSLSFGFSIETMATSKVEDVSVFYKNEEGKKLVEEKAKVVEKDLENIDAVIGTFSKKDLKTLEKSNDIVVVEKETKKLQIRSATNLAYKNNKTNWNQTMVSAKNAWGAGISGKGVKVGIIDTEAAKHASLPSIKRATFISDRNEINRDPSAKSHGTFVAGVIAAQPSKTSKVIGISPGVSLYNININGKSGADLNDFISAMDFAIEQKIQVINISMGISKSDLLSPGEKLTESPLYLAVKEAQDAGILIVAASGNYGSDVDYPAAFPNVVAVGSVSSNRSISSFSNKGSSLDFVAPGNDIQSLSYLGGTEYNSGTSFSAPHVTSIIALYKQKYPKESNTKILQRLKNSSVDLGKKGFDTTYGNGLATFPVVKVATTKAVTPAAKYVKSNTKKIASIIAKMERNKAINYLTEFTPVYTVYSDLSSSQKKKVNSYRSKTASTVISSTAKSSRVSATNLTKLQSKKTSKISFKTKLKASSVKSKSISMYKDGVKFTGFKASIAKAGSSMTIKTTKKLTKGTYYLSLDSSNYRTTKNKKVNPFIVKYTVK